MSAAPASAPPLSPDAVLRVEGLRVTFPTPAGELTAVDGVSLTVAPGRTLGIVGESGAGKTALATALMGLAGAAARVSGRALLAGEDLLAIPPARLRRLRGAAIALVFQDAQSALHPQLRVGVQIAEAVRAHQAVSRAAARARALELLRQVALPDPRRALDSYPHQLSGGMRQRALIALALANEPRVLIADEPTTALDVTVQAQILALLRRLRDERGMAMVLITHDLGVVAQAADEVAVMYAGRVIEQAPTAELLRVPQHPYTWGLLRATPRLDAPRGAPPAPIPGRPPSMLRPPSGCRFHPRCAWARERHRHVDPPLAPSAERPDHRVACLLSEDERRAIWARLAAGAVPPATLPAPAGGEDAAESDAAPAPSRDDAPGRGEGRP